MSAVSFARTQADFKAEFRPLFENSPLGWVQCDRYGNVAAMNQALEHMLGRPRESQGLPSLIDLIRPSDRAETERLVFDVVEARRDGFQVESSACSGKQLRWSVWRISPTNGANLPLLAVVEDCSTASASDRGRRHSDRLEAMGRLAGSIAHDFNNMLTGVLLYCDLLLANIEPCHRVRKYAEEIRKAGMEASALVRQLLAVARPPTSQPQPLSLNEIAGGMRNLLARLTGENVTLKFSLDSNLGLVRMDPTQAQQILLNLVLNARDAMPNGGQVTVETCNCKLEVLTGRGSGSKASLPCALLVVADTGHGMDAYTRARMFEPFFTTKADKGTGLGLVTVHEIVTTNGGLIHVESEPNQGTRIKVLLPLVSQPVLGVQEAKSLGPTACKQESSIEEE